MRGSVCPSKERLPGVPPGPRIRFSAARCSMSRATPASTAVPPCTSATIVSTASTPCRAPWSCPVAWLTAPTALARFAAKPSAAELLLGSCALRSARPPRALQCRQSAAGRVGGGVAPAASHRSGRAQLRHPARPVADSHALRYPWWSRGQLIEVRCPRAVARPRPRDEAPPSLPRVLAARVPRLPRYYGALRFPAVLAVSLRCLRETVTTPCACVRRSTQARRRLGARGVRVRPPPEPVVIEAETVGRPKFLGNPHFRLPCSTDAGRTAGTRPVRWRSMAPGM